MRGLASPITPSPRSPPRPPRGSTTATSPRCFMRRDTEETSLSEIEWPTVLRWAPYRAFFHSNERGEPPHIHVRAGDHEAKFWLHDLSVAVNAGCPAYEIGAIIRHLRSQRDLL